MAILVTRPQPDNEKTGASLRARGFDVLLAPMLRFEPVALPDEPDTDYAAVIVTSANALRAVEPQLAEYGLLGLPLFAVGERTAAAARKAGFGTVISADGDGADLRDLVVAQAGKWAKDKKSDKKSKIEKSKLEKFKIEKSKTWKSKDKKSKAEKINNARPLLYLAGAELSRDLASELAEHGLEIVTRTTYRMVASSVLPREVCSAIAANQIEAVLHYSARSARAFLDAVRSAGVEISALAVRQCCISATVAAILREAGATQVTVASSPDENALLGMLDRALRPRMA
jgi:uroporphyrinogen-III synthase